MNAAAENPKVAKKLAKVSAKAAKKQAQTTTPGGVGAEAARPPGSGPSPAERSAEAAERQVALHRWRVVLALATALIAIISLLIMWLRG